MPQILIIADDLTGALDSAVAFSRSGRRVRVARRVGDVGAALSGDPDVLAINTASREGSRAEAVASVRAALASLGSVDVPVVIKKVDSRLKGHVGAETAALAAGLGPRLATASVIAVPAIPGMGRVQTRGRIEGRGIDAPVAIRPLLGELGQDVLVPDVLSDEDMARAVAAAPDGPSSALWLGARGLAFALAETLFPGPAAPPPDLGPTLLLAIGSRDPVTLAQVAALPADVVRHDLPDGRRAGPVPGAPRLVVQLTDGGGARSGSAAGRDFAQAVAAIAADQRSETLLACGGETADAVLEALRIGVLEVEAEIAPGVPVCRTLAPWGSLRVITKSGGFGTPETLRDLVAAGGETRRREEVSQA